MARTKLPACSFEVGICLKRLIPEFGRLIERNQLYLIGRLEDGTPFQLYYDNGYTNWWCETTLGQSLRKKILGMLREDVRFQEKMPDFVTVHDMREADKSDLKASSDHGSTLAMAFHDDVWRERYLDDRDSDYQVLDVPYAEKGAADALGASFNGRIRKWWVKKRDDMTPFAKWLPKGDQ
ncbi:hypothetical protein HNP46_000251 [Pseudomonas nitritireducens]|uniref:DUF5710 domain-containing protein n=1 Tax=Pseudomonas nitroreducens TaxID=46680 RepID=A0A7W7NZM0_PSENT|nr:DUF5710 domain-containing protein [Pseudomonas nitritireducens]MBB4861440.1 hypothetical protein [Pseudomonas nitritireducens]